jgi:hypothetical protein
VLSEVDGIVEYHLAGTMDDYVAMSPSKSMVDFARHWAKDRGNRVLHLAGSLRRGDELIRFKLGFSPLLRPVLSWRIVSDIDVYSALTRAWSAHSRTTPDEPDGFFPAYRKQLPRPNHDVA